MIDAWNRNNLPSVPFSIQLHLICLLFWMNKIAMCVMTMHWYFSAAIPPPSPTHFRATSVSCQDLAHIKWHHSSVPVCCCRKQDHHSFQKKWVKIWLSCETRTIIACTQMCLAGLREGSDQEVVTCWSICDQDYNRCLFDLWTTVTQVIISFRGCQTLQWVTYKWLLLSNGPAFCTDLMQSTS